MTQKRKARLADCVYAAELARLYRERHPRPSNAGVVTPIKGGALDGLGIVNPTERRGLDIGDALEWFATHGTFEKNAADIAPWNAKACRLYFARARERDVPPEDAIAEIVESTGLSDSTVRHAVYRKPKKPAER